MTFRHLRSTVAACLAAAVVFLVTPGCGPATLVIGIGPGQQDLEKTTLATQPGRSGGEVAIVDVSGLIVNANRFGLLREGENPVSLLHEQLVAAGNDKRVKAVILRINSPGGGVTASDMMYRQVSRFRQQTGKPVVTLMMDVAASGGYYVALSGDEIVAYPTTITGSIGVLLQTVSFEPAMTRFGITADAITSGPNKDAGSPLETMTPEQRATLQAIVDDFYGRFVALVEQARPGVDPANLSTITDGRVFSGTEAARLGLVDELGDITTAWSAAERLAGIESSRLVRYHRPLRHVASPYAAAPGGERGGSTTINIASLDLGGISGLGPGQWPPGAYYVWAPGR